MSRPTRSIGCLRRIVCARFRPLPAAAVGALALAACVEAQPLPTRPDELLALHPDCLIERVARSRPDPISDRGKAAARRMLPLHGEITDLPPRSVEKIRSLAHVLRVADRHSIYDIKVVDVPQAAAGNHLRAVLVVSRPALDLLEPAELQAIVAHELAHEYVWREHEEASSRRDTFRLRELELVCDGIAVLTLRTAGVDPMALPRAVEKIGRFNRRLFGRAANEASYPSIEERRRLADTLATAYAAPPPPGSAESATCGARPASH